MKMDISMENDKPKRASVEYLVREIFHDLFSSENGDLPFSGTKGHSHTEQIENYEIAVCEINDTTKKIEQGRAKHEERLKKIARDSRAVELIRLKRRPIHDPLESSIIEKYALLDAQDLLPNIEKRNVDFRLNDSARNRWSKDVSIKSDDSLFKVPEIPAKTVRTIETISHQRKKSKHDETSLHSLESSEKKSKIRRSIIKSEPQKIVLVARPSSVEFKNFIPQQNYQRTIAIKNVSKKVAKFQLEPRAGSSKFSIELESRSGNGGNVAPGIRVKLLVKFSSDDSEDYEERIVVRVQSAKDAVIFLRAYREPPVLRGTNYRLMIYKELSNDEQDFNEKLSLIEVNGSCENSSENSWNLSGDKSSLSSTETSESSDDSGQEINTCGHLSFAQFECSKCFVGEQIIILTRLKNFGGDGKFFIMSEIDWNSMSIDDVTSENLIVLSCFAMWPVYFSLKRNEEIDLVTYFSPNSRGVQVDKLYMVCDNLAIHPIELLGDGVMYDTNLIKIDRALAENSRGDQESGEWLEEKPMDDGFDYSMNLIIEGDEEIVQETLRIVNTSPIEMYYRWDKSVSGTIEPEEELKNWKNLPHDLVTVYPESGIIRACETITFKISLRLPSSLDDAYRVVLRFVIIDIPLAAMPLDYDDFTEPCAERRRICETSVDVRAKEIAVWARYAGYPSLRSYASGTSYENIEDDRSSYVRNTKIPVI